LRPHRAAILALLVLTSAACQHEGVPPAGQTAATGPAGVSEATPADAGPSTQQQAEAHYLLGRAHEASGEALAAVEDYEAALALDPWHRSGADQVSGTPYDGMVRLCEGDGSPEAVIRACSAIALSLRFAPARLARFHAHRARARFRQGDAARALADLENASKLDSGSPEVLFALGQVREAMGEPAAALRDYTRALFGWPGLVEARLARGRLRARLNDLTGAEEDFDTVLSDAGAVADHPEAYRDRARVHCRLGKHEAAAVGWQVWAGQVPGGESYLAEMLEARGYLRNPAPRGWPPHAQAALAAWTREGCPEG